MKEYTVKDISIRTGLDRFKINQFSDIVKPVSWSNRGYERLDGTSVDGYKLYDEAGLKKFMVISLLLKLGVRRKRIRQMFINGESINNLYKLAADEAKEKIKEYEDIHIIATNLETASSIFDQDDLLTFVDIFGMKNLADWIRNSKASDYSREYVSAYENMEINSRNRFDLLLSQMNYAIEKTLDCDSTIKEAYDIVSEFTPFRVLKKQNTFISLIAIARYGSGGLRIENKFLEYCITPKLEKVFKKFDVDPESEDPEVFKDLVIEDENGDQIYNIKSAFLQGMAEELYSAFDQVLEIEILQDVDGPLFEAIFDYLISEDDSLDEEGLEFMEAFKKAMLYYIRSKKEN